MSFEIGLVLILGFGAALIVVLNDWTKRSYIKEALRKGEKPKRDLGPSKTNWMAVIALVVGTVVYALMLANRDWLLSYDWGRWQQLVEWILWQGK